MNFPRNPIPFRLLRCALLLLLVGGLAWAQSDADTAPATPETPAAATESAPADAAEPAAADADPVVLQIGNTVERRSDLAWRFEVAVRNIAAQRGMAYTAEVAGMLRPLLPTYLDQRAQELALVVEARRRGLTPDEEELQGALDSIRSSASTPEEYAALLAGAGFTDEAQVHQMLVEADIVAQLLDALREEAAASVTEPVLKARYLAERERYRQPESICARHILVAEQELADELLERLQAGEEFADLAAEYGTDGTSSNGGDLGCFGRGMMVPDFEAAVLDAEVGVPTGPVETQFGYHLLLVYDRTDARVMPFEEVRTEVREYVLSLATDAAVRGIIGGSGAVTYPENLPVEQAE